MNLTPTGFGIIVAILLVVAVIAVIADNLRDRKDAQDDYWERGAELAQRADWERETRKDAQDEPGPDATCAIGDCTRYAAVLFPSSTGVMWVCRFHAAQVSEWTGPALFDQDESGAA